MTEKQHVKIPEERKEHRAEFIRQIGWENADIETLSNDAGSRGYFKLTKGKDAALLMDMPFEFLKLKEYLLIGDALQEIGVRTPEIYHVDLERGFALIEDMGDKLYADLFDAGENKEPYIMKAMELLVYIHKNLDISPLEGAINDELDWYLWEASSLTDWFYPAKAGHETPPDLVAEYMMIWKTLLNKLPPLGFKTLSMIDYHAPNLFEIDGKEVYQQVGVIDFQDGVIGSPAYDVMSLLEDDRRRLDPAIREKALNYYLKEMGDMLDEDTFRLHLAVLSAQRHSKNMGNFLRIIVQKDSERFLKYLPICIEWFDHSIPHPYLEPLKKWFDKNLSNYNEPMSMSDIRTWKQS